MSTATPDMAQARDQAHQLLAAGVPGWPRTLADANASRCHRLVERMLAAVLASHHTPNTCATPATPRAAGIQLRPLRGIDCKSLAAGEHLKTE